MIFYDSLKIFHVLSAALFLTSVVYCYHLWSRSKRARVLAFTALKIQMQTWLVILPTLIIQLATGFSMISLKHENFSETWILGSVFGFIIVIGCWFSFIYTLVLSQQLTAGNQIQGLAKFKSLRRIQFIMLALCGFALLSMIYLMANKVS